MFLYTISGYRQHYSISCIIPSVVRETRSSKWLNMRADVVYWQALTYKNATEIKIIGKYL
jgi:hypothetical protein